MGGKPSKQTPADRRLKRNRDKDRLPKEMRPPKRTQ